MRRKTVWLGILITVIVTASSAFWFLSKKDTVKLSSEYSNPFTKNPGWYKDYVVLKGLDQVNIPFDLKYQWFKHDQKNARLHKKGPSTLENIKEIGPYNVGGRTRSILIDYNNENRVLAGGVSGGLWYSNNGGSAWSAADDNAVTLSVTSITQSPFNPDMIYYGTGETYNNTLNVNGQGLFRSTNGGVSNQHLENTVIASLAEIWDVQHSLVFDSTIYVGTQSGGLWRSNNAGDTFTRIYSTSGAIHEINAFTDSTIMFGVSGSGIYILNETSLQTTKLANGLPTNNFSRISFDYCDAAPNVIYAQFLTSDFRDIRGSYKSVNKGQSWTAITNPTQVNYSQGWYDFKLGVSPTDPNFLVSMGVTAAYSNDGGSSWIAMYNSHADYHEIQFYADGQSFLIGNDGGVYRYSINSLSTSATDLNQGYNVTQFYAGHYHPSKADVIAGAQDNNTRYSVNGSPSFLRVFNGDGAFCAINQQNPNVYYVSSQYLNLYRNSSGNLTNINSYIYSQIGSQANTWFINPFEMNPLDGNQLYVPTKKEVFRTNNQGNSWIKLTSDLPGSTYSIGLSWDEDPIAYIGGTGSILHRLDNAASNALTEVALYTKSPIEFRGNTIGCIEVDPNDAGTIYCAMSNISTRGRIWKVTGADTEDPVFTDLHANLPESLAVSWVEVDPDNSNFIIIATDYGLYTSTNGGGWWEKEDRIPNVAIDQIRLRHSDRKLYIFTHGRGAWTADLAEAPTASINSLSSEHKLNIYPNPSTDYFHIDTKGFVSYKLYNSKGELVKEGVETKVDVRFLLAGVYFVELKAGNTSTVSKVIISRS